MHTVNSHLSSQFEREVASLPSLLYQIESSVDSMQKKQQASYWLMIPAAISAILLASFIPDYFLGHPLSFPFPPPSLFIYSLGLIALIDAFRRRALIWNKTAKSLLFWCGFCMFLVLLGFFPKGVNYDNMVVFKNRLYAIITLMSIFSICSLPKGRKLISLALVIVTFIDLFFIGWDMVAPGTFSEVFGRAAGLFQNPTIAGQGLIAGMIAIWEEIPKKWRSLMFLLVGIATLSTFSRGSIVSWFLLWVGGWMVGLWRLKDNWKSQLLLIFFLLFMLLYMQMGALEQLDWDALNENTLNRLQFGLQDGSAIERGQIAQLAWAKVSESPWWGHGLGMSLYTSSQSTHNMHLTLWIDHGLLGLLVLPLLVWPLWNKGASPKLFLIYTLFFAFFTHNLLDERNLLIPLAFLLSRPNQRLDTYSTRFLLPDAL